MENERSVPLNMI